MLPGLAAAQEPGSGESGRAAPAVVRLSLEEAIEMALDGSEEVRLAQAQVMEAGAKVQTAWSAAMPEVTTSLLYTRLFRSVFQNVGFELPDSLQFRPDPTLPVEDRLKYLEDMTPIAGLGGLGTLFSNMPFGRANTWNGALQVTQPLFTGGRITAGVSAASAAEDLARLNLEETSADIELQVKEAYYGAVLAEHMAEIAAAGVELAEEHLKQVRLFERQGQASELDVLRAEVERQNLEPQLVQARNARALALLNLKRLVNLPMDAEVELVTDLTTGGTPPAPGAGLPSLAEALPELERQPRVRMAEEQIAIRQAQARIARAAYLPTVALTSTFARQAYPAQVFPRSGEEWMDDWSLALAVQLPLFQGFRRGAELDAAKAQVRQAELQLEQLREGVRLEYERALGELERARAQMTARARTVEQAERVYRLTELRYEKGLATQLDVSDARLALQQARINAVQADYDYYVALARAERALGRAPGETTLPTGRRTPGGAGAAVTPEPERTEVER